MKKFDVLKTLQLILFVILAGIGLYIILTDARLYQLIASDVQIRKLCALLWVSLVLSFFFIFMDFSLFSSYKRELKELDYAVSSDPVSGIANRYSCDALIEKYLDKPLPPGIGCIMFDLTNIKDINEVHGHIMGNDLIREFSGILQSASYNLCFVGRNGGNKFLALFEDCTNEKLKTFLNRVDNKVQRHNTMSDDVLIHYNYGIAFGKKDDVSTITDLIALSNSRINKEH